MRKLIAVLKKQWKETLKNKEVLIQFILFPMMAVIMTNAINVEGMPANFFIILFAAMYVGMAPLTSVVAIIAEEKEKNTLRILRMSNVSSMQYLLGIGSYVFVMCILGASVFAAVGKYAGLDFLKFLLVMAVGTIVSILIGAVIGTSSKSQMNATAVLMPVMMIFSFLPMMATFNEHIAKVSKYVYSQQIQNLLNSIPDGTVKLENIGIIAVNILLAALIFIIVYKKSGYAGAR